MSSTGQELYTMAQDILNRRTVYGRSVLFKQLGGKIAAPDKDGFLPEECVWHASLLGTTKEADTCDAAICDWAENALGQVRRLASDGRPDCPYNGAGLAPSPTPAA
jgi:hypothetical protein